MRSFEFAMKPELDENNKATGEMVQAFSGAQLPEYQTEYAAAADFFCAEEVVVPSIWNSVFSFIRKHYTLSGHFMLQEKIGEDEKPKYQKMFKPTLVHTGIKADMNDDEVLGIVNRSSGPKRGLILANNFGVIDKDYYGNIDNDGEIGFIFYNILPWSVTIKVGDRIGQGMFQKILRPDVNCRVKTDVRTGGFGSTGSK